MSQADALATRPAAARSETGAARSAFVARLHIILRQWPSVDRLAREMQVSPSAFRKWLKGEAEPSRERLIALAEAARVNIAWLVTGEGPSPGFIVHDGGHKNGHKPEGSVQPAHEQFVIFSDHTAAHAGALPVTGLAAATGILALRHDWITATLRTLPDNLALEVAAGEAMNPTIRNGDLLLIDTSERDLRTVGIYALDLAGLRATRRVQRNLDGAVRLICDNRAYEAELVPSDQAAEMKIVGRVIWSAGKI